MLSELRARQTERDPASRTPSGPAATRSLTRPSGHTLWPQYGSAVLSNVRRTRPTGEMDAREDGRDYYSLGLTVLAEISPETSILGTIEYQNDHSTYPSNINLTKATGLPFGAGGTICDLTRSIGVGDLGRDTVGFLRFNCPEGAPFSVLCFHEDPAACAHLLAGATPQYQLCNRKHHHLRIQLCEPYRRRANAHPCPGSQRTRFCYSRNNRCVGNRPPAAGRRLTGTRSVIRRLPL